MGYQYISLYLGDGICKILSFWKISDLECESVQKPAGVRTSGIKTDVRICGQSEQVALSLCFSEKLLFQNSEMRGHYEKSSHPDPNRHG